MRQLREAHAGGDLVRIAARHGVEPVDPAGTLTVDPCPADLQVAVAPRRSVMRYVPYNGAGLAAPLAPRRPDGPARVCVTMGTTTAQVVGHLGRIQEVVTALAGTGVEPVVAVLGAQRDTIGDLPSGVRVVEDVPLGALLAGCDAVVHQGGAGTTIAALLAATPQLVLPAWGDQFMHGERVRTLGLGHALESADAGPDALRAAVTDLLTCPSYRQAAQRISTRAAGQPAPARVVHDVERLVGD